MIPAELRHRPAKIGIPDVVPERDYDLVCISATSRKKSQSSRLRG
jgi:hypothetical protein